MTHAAQNGTIAIERDFDAPRELVFSDFIDPAEVATWFAPDGYEVTHCTVDARPGGRWRVEFASASGERHCEYGEFRVVDAPVQLAFTLTQENAAGGVGPTTLVTVTFAEHAGGTRMRFVQSGYVSNAMRDANAEGWRECFGKLERRLATASDETAIRKLYADWFRATAARDLDAIMAPIADGVVSYEHEAPLQYVGAAGLREICARGLDAGGDVCWDVPALTVIVSGDLAVTWGLNRMTGRGPDGTTFESASRGTRAFRKVGGRWTMIHQHVSYPYDPASGNACTDLSPP